jgi:uncharacterized membrane protein
MEKVSIIIMSIFYIAAGLNHFKNPNLYIKMIPGYLPYPKVLNHLSGAAEVVLGLMLFYEPVRNYALLGIIALLIAVFPANIEMVNSEHFKTIPKKFKILRLPLQAVVIYWAYIHLNL